MAINSGSPCNLLFIVVDQFRTDLITGRFAPFVELPNLRRLADESVVFANHHTVTVPCGPARASLLTGQYAMNHRSIRNGTPLSNRHPNLATELREIGQELLLFGYTDTQPDPSALYHQDPAHQSYTAPIRGITEVVEMREEAWAWLAHLRRKGYDVPDAGAEDFDRLYRPLDGIPGNPALYRAEDSDTAVLTDRTLEQLDVRKSRPWSALVTYIRPHPPFVAPAPWHAHADPAAMPVAAKPAFDHPFVDAFHSAPSQQDLFWGFNGQQQSLNDKEIARTRATYLGLAAEVDHHIGRLLTWLDDTHQSDDTLVIFTADHGEMLGDLGQWGKQTVFRAASHIPLMMRFPGEAPGCVETITRSIDVAPTILDAFGARVPVQMVGGVLLSAQNPATVAMVEVDFGVEHRQGRYEKAWNAPTEACRAAILEDERWRFVHFAADGVPPMLFNVADDPDCTRNLAPGHPDQVAELQARLLSHRMQNAARLF